MATEFTADTWRDHGVQHSKRSEEMNWSAMLCMVFSSVLIEECFRKFGDESQFLPIFNLPSSMTILPDSSRFRNSGRSSSILLEASFSKDSSPKTLLRASSMPHVAATTQTILFCSQFWKFIIISFRSSCQESKLKAAVAKSARQFSFSLREIS